ncbi:MAG: non-canonical purine NTP pyrophosphatase [Firmicutes bacterium]|nr:non-canonical purine NTP pyrophosphatase [Bacillota bacterium]
MSELVFVTGNQHKAEMASKMLGVAVGYQKVDVPEIQSLDLREIIEFKLREAYKITGKTVIVEDVSSEFSELGRLPGTLVKFFVDEMGVEKMCGLIGSNRKAVVKCILGWTDGKDVQFFEGRLDGQIADQPRGKGGFGFDKIFVPNGFGGKTAAELTDEEYDEYYSQTKRFDKMKEFIGGGK